MTPRSHGKPKPASSLLAMIPLLLAQAVGSPAVRPVDATDIQKLISHHRGKVVLVNFWATWCPPCIREFPEIVALAREYDERGLAVISVSADDPGRTDSELLPFLEKHKPGFPVYIIDTEDPNRFVRTIDPEWSGTIPTTLFIDRTGKGSVKRYSEMSRGEIVRILEALLEEPKK